MTNEEIFTALNINEASEGVRQATIQNISAVVELRALGALSDLITEEQANHLESMEADGASKQEMLDWMSQNVANASEMIEALTRDYVAQLASRHQ